jgi:hypothetical protein
MFQAKYTSKATANKYGLDMRLEEFTACMADYEKTVSITKDVVLVKDAETGEVVDVADYILVKGTDGEWYANLLLNEMNSMLTCGDGKYDDCTNEDIEINGYPLHVKRMLNQ